MECNYEVQKREVKFVSMKTPDVSNPRMKKQKSFKYSIPFSGSTTVVKELDVLKQRIHSLESLLSKRNVSSTSDNMSYSPYVKIERNAHFGSNNVVPLDLSNYEDFNFYHNLETVDVKGGRLSFTGALNYISISKVDPYLMTITTLVRKAHNDRSNQFIRRVQNRKYSNLEYIPALAKEVFVANRNETDTAVNLLVEIYNDECSTSNITEKDDSANVTDDENNDVEGVRDTVKDSTSEFEVGNQAQRAKFARKYLEDENLDGILTNEKGSNRPSLAEIINTSAIIKSNEDSPKSRTSSGSKISKNHNGYFEATQCDNNVRQTREQSLTDKTQSKSENTPASLDEETEILNYIRMLLPPAKLIWIHLDNYFSSPLHALYPFSTEDWFKDMIAGILGGRSESEKPPPLKIEKKLDFAKLATFFVIMRLSYLMFPADLEHCSTEEEKYVVSHEIGTVYIDVANLCMRMFNLWRRGVLPVLHCLLLLRVYRRYAPEEGDIADGADSSTFTGSLVQIAQSLGINTDAEASYQLTNFEIYLHSWRKAWYTIYFMDVSEAMNMGNCFTIDVDQFNTKLPHIKREEDGSIPEFFLNPTHEVASVDCYRKNFEFSLHVRKLLKVVMNKRNRSPCNTIMDRIAKVENNLKINYSEDLSYMISSGVEGSQLCIEKCNNFRMYVNTQSMLLIIKLRLFIHLDSHHAELKVNNFHEPFQLLKMCLSLYVELEPLLILLHFHNQNDENDISYIEKIFGPKSKIIILQACNHIFVRCQTVLHILLSRLIHLYHGYLKNPDPVYGSSKHFFQIKELVTKIIENALDKLHFANSVTQSLSGRQFQAWRLSKGNRFLYSLFKDEKNNIFDPHSPINTAFQNLGIQRDNLGVPLLIDNLNPAKKLPKYNNFLLLDLSQFEELYSIMNSTRWSIFSGIFNEDKLKEALNFRISEHKQSISTKTEKRRKRSSSTSNPTPAPPCKEVLDSVSLSSKSSDGNDGTGLNLPQLKVNEVDTHWFNAILRNNNTHSSWNRDDFDNHAVPPGSITTQSPLVIEADGLLSDLAKAPNISLDEMFLNPSFQQESLIQQLQNLSERQNSGMMLPNSTNNLGGSITGAPFSNDHLKNPPKTNFNSIIDSTDLDYLLFNGDI